MPAIAHRWLYGVEDAPRRAVAVARVAVQWQQVRLLVTAALIAVGVGERVSPNLGGWRL
jgi:hypothetical protein